MRTARRFAIVIATAIIAVTGFELGAEFTAPAGFVSGAEARVGRPLTPVSVAGVARRTSRRCAVGVYYC